MNDTSKGETIIGVATAKDGELVEVAPFGTIPVLGGIGVAEPWVLRSLRPDDAYIHGQHVAVKYVGALEPGHGELLEQNPPQPDGYSSRFNVTWTDDQREGLAGWLTLLARDVMNGKVEIRGARYSFYHKLGTDFDGAQGVNLDSGDRTFEFVYHRPGDKQA